MYWRGVVLSLAAVSLLGCASERTGADFAAMTQKVGPPRAGQARIVVLREKGFSGIGDPGWDVKLDGGPLSDLKSGTYGRNGRPGDDCRASAGGIKLA